MSTSRRTTREEALSMIGRLHAFVLDCPDPVALAGFYGAILDLQIGYQDDDWVVLGDRDSHPHLAFQLAPDHERPQWPDPHHPQQMHLDLHVDDIEASEVRVLALGARRLPGGEEGFRVYADPAGHPFCLLYET